MTRWLFRRRRSDRASEASIDARLNGISDHDIEASVERAESRESIAAWVVIAGVALESYFRSIDFFTNPSWRSFDDLFGGALIVIGIAAEIYFGGKASGGRKLQVARLNLIAEQERLARAKIEERLAFRSITETQKAEAVEILKHYSGQRYMASCVSLTPEIEGVCGWLSKLLRESGWVFHGSSMIIFQDLVLTGIRISTGPKADQQSRDAADLLRETLQVCSIAAYRSDEDWIELPATISITVGSKPQ
jgi:hypothetical protein